jgi:putative hydrolase
MAITQLGCDVHTHTLQSRHAYSTIGENVGEASAIGLELLGSSDHFGRQFTPFDPTGDEVSRSYQFWLNLRTWPRVWRGVHLAHGCEADIVDLDGHLFGYDIPVEYAMSCEPLPEAHTLKDGVFYRVDYVIASVHRADFALAATPAQNTRMYVNALQDPKVLTLGHIGRTGLDFDIDAVVRTAHELGKPIEINEHTFDSTDGKRCCRIAERCAELGCKIIVSTDAHISCSVGRFPNSIAMLNSIGFPEELVATRSLAAFDEVMDESGIGRIDWDDGLHRSDI